VRERSSARFRTSIPISSWGAHAWSAHLKRAWTFAVDKSRSDDYGLGAKPATASSTATTAEKKRTSEQPSPGSNHDARQAFAQEVGTSPRNCAFCCEAGPCGIIIAPSLIARKVVIASRPVAAIRRRCAKHHENRQRSPSVRQSSRRPCTIVTSPVSQTLYGLARDTVHATSSMPAASAHRQPGLRKSAD
jgi:hypothetical protein